MLKKSPDEEVVAFIRKYVTYEIPDENISPTLYEMIIRNQNHKHNSYCMRKKLKRIFTESVGSIFFGLLIISF